MTGPFHLQPDGAWSDEDEEVEGAWVPSEWPCEEVLYREDAEREDQVNRLLNTLRDD